MAEKDGQFFKENGIKMDFGRRGIYDPRLRSLNQSIATVFELDSSVVPASVH